MKREGVGLMLSAAKRAGTTKDTPRTQGRGKQGSGVGIPDKAHTSWFLTDRLKLAPSISGRYSGRYGLFGGHVRETATMTHGHDVIHDRRTDSQRQTPLQYDVNKLTHCKHVNNGLLGGVSR